VRSRPLYTSFLLPAALIAAALAAYANSFGGPFVFDDIASIPDNPSLRAWSSALHPPPGGATVSGRPVLNLSFAVDYAIHGYSIVGYHVVNLAIHALAALVLFSLIRRLSPGSGPGVAAAAALLWVLHPLQTESVTYIVQRAEALAGLLGLLSLYSYARYAGEPPRASAWGIAACMYAALAMACKETAVVLPLLALLQDRTFHSGSFSAAWRRHWRAYVGLGATWIVLGFLVFSGPDRGGTAGPGLGLSAALIYARTQPAAILHYLRLALWPSPLVFDYGTGWTAHDGGVFWPAVSIAALLIAAAIALRRNPAAGFLAAAFFLLLAPSSSFIPIATERMAEHRMYLPLAAIAAGAAVLLARILGSRGLIAATALAFAGGMLTAARNRAYTSDVTLWRDTVEKQPDNPSAHDNLGYGLFQRGLFSEATAEFDRALALDPENAVACNHRGRALASLGRLHDAQSDFETALLLRPDYAEAHNNLGVILAISGDRAGAIAQFEAALRLRPDYPEARSNLTRATGTR
jgi:tetratricopeptide (TPR) repeat protein